MTSPGKTSCPDIDAAPWTSTRAARLGLLFWILFSVAVVFIRGIRWDEQLEFAQMVTGALAYPLDHPYVVCVRNALNAQIYGTSLLLWLTDSPAIVCGVRNVLALLSTILPAYLFGVLLGRRALAGHVAVALTLMGIHLSFDACYPMVTWGRFFTTGHIGLGYALITLYLIVAGHRRSGGFLLGFMPAVHIAQMPIILGLWCIRTAVAWKQHQRNAAKQTIVWFAIGLAVCAAFILGVSQFKVTPPTSGPYYSDADPQPIWEGIIATDAHRAAPGGAVSYDSTHFILFATLILVAGLIWSEKKNGTLSEPLIVTLGYVLLCTVTIESIMLLHRVLGSNIPYVIIAWMPYRLSNHVAVLLVAVLPAILLAGVRRHDAALPEATCRRPLEQESLGSTRPGSSTPALPGQAFSARAGYIICTMTLLYALVRPIAGMVVDEIFYNRYIADGAAVLFALVGAAAVMLLISFREDRVAFRVGIVVSVSGLLNLAIVHQFGAACVVLGAIATLIANGRASVPASCVDTHDRSLWRYSRATAAACAIAIAFMLVQQYQHREWLPRSAFDRACIEYMNRAEEGLPPLGPPRTRRGGAAMVVARPDQYLLQSRINHPVMVDIALAPWTPYMPSVGPSIEKIHNDIYGISFVVNAAHSDWTTVWKSRTQTQWTALAQEYDFRYVVSPNNVPLQLLEAVRGPDETLYTIRNS